MSRIPEDKWSDSQRKFFSQRVECPVSQRIKCPFSPETFWNIPFPIVPFLPRLYKCRCIVYHYKAFSWNFICQTIKGSCLTIFTCNGQYRAFEFPLESVFQQKIAAAYFFRWQRSNNTLYTIAIYCSNSDSRENSKGLNCLFHWNIVKHDFFVVCQIKYHDKVFKYDKYLHSYNLGKGTMGNGTFQNVSGNKRHFILRETGHFILW